MWWLFILVVTSSYTANLAAFLTVERMESPIESAEDLAKQTKIKYGCLESGSTRAFFRDSKMPTFSRMYAFMESQKNPKTFTSSNKDGVQRVIDSSGEYAFLMESNSIQYQVERNCDLLQVGKLLDSKGYGIAFTPGSVYRVPISSAILQLQEAGRLHILKNRWWKQRRGGGKCDDTDKKSEANELSVDSVGGVFVVLIGGMGVACLISVLEFLWKRRSLENKAGGVLASSLVARALINTNCETFNTAHHEGTICAHRIAFTESPASSLDSNDGSPPPVEHLDLASTSGCAIAEESVLHEYYCSCLSPANTSDHCFAISEEKERKRPESCGPFSKHSFCYQHCDKAHLTYSGANCFDTLTCSS